MQGTRTHIAGAYASRPLAHRGVHVPELADDDTLDGLSHFMLTITGDLDLHDDRHILVVTLEPGRALLSDGNEDVLHV